MLLRSKEHEVVEVALSCSPADEAGASQNPLPQHRHAFIEKIRSGVTFLQRANRRSLAIHSSRTNGAGHWRATGCVVTGMRSSVRNEVFPGVVGLLLVAAALAIPSDGADARYAHFSAHAGGYSPPSSSIVVDGNTGKVLQESNPDAPRHPASLTKIMTLYLLFERLGVHKIKRDTPLKVSAKAAGQLPSTLGLKAGETIAVEDLIKAVVTRSANDAAVVIAENLGGDEGRFAKLMTQKARTLGMSRTTYVNASGLPNDDQITTARDQALLGRAIQERYPSYYKYFSIQSFEFRGEAIHNHNHLLGSTDGVDGIKTGFTHASGFNLVTSVHRDGHYIVAVVLGGRSALARDAHMRELINAHINEAGLRRTASVFAVRQTRKPQVLAVGKAPLSSGDDPSPSTPVTASSSDPIQSLPVKTISYHAPAQAAVAPMLLTATTLQTVAPAASAPPPHLSDAPSTILPANRFTTAPAQPASTAGATQPRTQISNARNDITLSSSDVGTSNIKTQPTFMASANAGEILEQGAQHATVRGVPREATEPSVFAKNETERLIRTDAEARTTADTSSVQPREPIAGLPRVTPLVVFLFLSLGLPGVSILAWLVIKADTARGKRLADRLDEQSQADWIDDFLANWRQSLTKPNSVFASPRKSEGATTYLSQVFYASGLPSS
jgi:D-alanyl-D-alanine carboxypeptidase